MNPTRDTNRKNSSCPITKTNRTGASSSSFNTPVAPTAQTLERLRNNKESHEKIFNSSDDLVCQMNKCPTNWRRGFKAPEPPQHLLLLHLPISSPTSVINYYLCIETEREHCPSNDQRSIYWRLVVDPLPRIVCPAGECEWVAWTVWKEDPPTTWCGDDIQISLARASQKEQSSSKRADELAVA